MIGIRQKILLGFIGMLVIVAVMGFLTVNQIDRLGTAIEVILKENYRSVVASGKMIDAIEKIDNSLLGSVVGKEDADPGILGQNETFFREALAVELGNITIPGEGVKAKNIARLFESYVVGTRLVADSSRPVAFRREYYFTKLHPICAEIKNLAGEVLGMNQASMTNAGIAARRMAASAHNRILGAIIASALISLLFGYQSRNWILKPIRKLIASANEIKSGNLELVIEKGSNDEIGILSEAFNEMALTLRRAKKIDDETLHRTRLASQEVMNLLPAPIAIIDPEGTVTVATKSAVEIFGLQLGRPLTDSASSVLCDIVNRSIREMRAVEAEEQRYIQIFKGNREYFFQPQAAPVPPFKETEKLNGTVLLFKDVTQAHEQKELKRSVVSTVSHQLRTPLTALRMSIHLLLEEKIGPVNAKQEELLLTARESSDRLTEILDELLDLNRIEAGKATIDLQPLQPDAIVTRGVEPFLPEARDKGVTIFTETAENLPDVLADRAIIQHVLSNLLSNAIRHTSPGGTITVRAEQENGDIRFSVEDTGQGIPPEHLQHIFEQFYQVPGQRQTTGVGLGLAIVKQMVEALGGSTGASSTPGHGSVFHFILPAEPGKS
ncbi:MAG: HAMP domain-containing protein [Chlorobiaceae bacterium]|nr:HAMP domain-containing protein [Chlorobiaceae bacterium]